MNYVDLALRKAKEEKGMSIMEIGKTIGVSRVTINTWRRQGYVPERWVLAFSRVVNVPPWDVTRLAKEMRA